MQSFDMEKTDNILTRLEEAAGKYPEKTVYIDGEKQVNFGEVVLKARAVGSYLLRKNIGDGPVAVMLKRSVDTIIVFLGVVYSGHAYAPVGTDIPEERREKILKKLCPSFVIDERNVKEALGDKIDHRLLDRVRQRMTVTDPLYIIFTSGSSGDPKGVITSQLSLMNYIRSYSRVMGIGPEDTMASQSPLDYIAAIRDIYVPLFTGASDVLIPKEYFMQPEILFAALNEHKVSCISWSTSALTVLSKLKAFKEAKPEYIDKVCFSGSVMSPVVLREWQDALPGALFVNQYGPTETTASCTYQVIDHPVESDEVIPVGIPFDNYRVFLLSEDDKAVEDGEEGEIVVGGVGVTLGYINDPDRTAAAFVQNPLQSAYFDRIYRTGDIGVIKDGILMYHGRRDRQIKYMGHRVELDEIESAASAAGINGAALYDEKKEMLWFFYEGEKNTREVALALRDKLPGFMVPRKIKNLESLPLLPNGKTDFNVLRNMIH